MPNQPKTPARTVRLDDELWNAVQAKAEADGTSASDIVRKALKQMLGTLPLVLALATLLVWGGREVQAPWGETQGEVFSQSQVADWSNQIIAEQVTALGCDTTPRISERIAVRNAKGFDRGVVRVVSFASGAEQAKAGAVWVVGYCG